jgi:uncharacterized protein with HEPN domain
MKKEVIIFIQDISESIKKIEEYAKDINKKEFLNKEDNVQIQDAIIRRLEIIGEAVKGLPVNFKKKYSDIPWKKIAGMRDILIHEYFGVNLERVWVAAKKDLPELKTKILKILKELERLEENDKGRKLIR